MTRNETLLPKEHVGAVLPEYNAERNAARDAARNAERNS